jgi:hypothetical protein
MVLLLVRRDITTHDASMALGLLRFVKREREAGSHQLEVHIYREEGTRESSCATSQAHAKWFAREHG